MNVRQYYTQVLKIVPTARVQIRVSSPFREDTNPSFSINLEDGVWFDHGTGEGGDIIDFERRLNGCDYKTACKHLAAFIMGSNSLRSKAKHSEKQDRAITRNELEKWKQSLFSKEGDRARKYLNSRGLHDDTLLKSEIGFNENVSAVIIPLWIVGDLIVSLKRYHFEGDRWKFKKGKKEVTSHGETVLYCADHLGETDPIIITEGELDCLILRQNGFQAVTGTGGAGTWKPSWNQVLKGHDVVLCYDSDAAGRKGSANVRKSLISVCKSIKNIDLFGKSASPEMKDVTDFFIKARKSSTELKQLIDATLTITTLGFNPPSQTVVMNSPRAATIIVNPAQDYFNETVVYAITHQGKCALLTSKKEIIPFDECESTGLKLSAKEVDTMKLSNEGIESFLRGAQVSPYAIFVKLRDYFKLYVVVRDPETYNLLALWTMGSYLFRIFMYFPYLHLLGEKQCGKTLLLDLLSEVCFNGELSTNATPSVLYRDVHNNSLTMCLDEVEKLGRQDKEMHGAVMSILNVGFSKSGCVKRCVGQKMDKIQRFIAYSPKALAGIKDVDDVLSDRMIKIRMLRRLQRETISRYVGSSAVRRLQAEIRDSLYHFGLTFGVEIAMLYTENLESVKGLAHLSNREFDLWAPIMVIANVVDVARGDGSATVTDSMIRLSQKQVSMRNLDNERENGTVVLLTVLNRMLKQLSPVQTIGSEMYFTTDEVFKYFTSEEEYDWLEKKTRLSRLLTKIEITVKTVKIQGKSAKVYVLDSENLKDYTSRFLPDENESVTVAQSVTEIVA